jgi:hypothetical protein
MFAVFEMGQFSRSVFVAVNDEHIVKLRFRNRWWGGNPQALYNFRHGVGMIHHQYHIPLVIGRNPVHQLIYRIE